MKLSLLGLDGLPLDLLNRAISKLDLKGLRRAVEGGLKLQLRSVPPITPTAWTSIATGVNPAKHGVWGFTKYYRGQGGEHLSRPYTSVDVQFPRVFEDAAMKGLDVTVVNYPLTWPLGSLCCLDRMTVVGDTFLAPRVEFSPGSLSSELRDYFPTPSDLGDPYSRTEKLVEGIHRLLSAVDSDAYFIVLPFPDQAFHRDHREVLSVGRRSAEVWEAIDGLVQELESRSENMILVSDHGIGVHRTCVNALAPLMECFGVGLPSSVKGRLALRLVTIMDRLSTHMPPSLSPRELSRRGPISAIRGRLSRLLGQVARAATHETAGSESELSRQPFTYDAGGLSIDRLLYFRDEASRDKALKCLAGDEVSKYLRVRRVEEVFRGVHMPSYPALFLESMDDDRFHVISSRSLARVRRDLMPDHRELGVMVVLSPQAKASAGVGLASVYDVTPTALSLMGLPIPRGSDGVSLAGGEVTEYPYDAAARVRRLSRRGP